MPKRKVASTPSGSPLTLRLSPSLIADIKLLSAARKGGATAGKPAFILGIVDEAILALAAQVKAGKAIAFIPMPRSSEGRTSLRVSAKVHATAIRTAEIADVKLADFIRTALSIYVQDHADEIHQKAKAPADRARKPTRRKI